MALFTNGDFVTVSQKGFIMIFKYTLANAPTFYAQQVSANISPFPLYKVILRESNNEVYVMS